MPSRWWPRRRRSISSIPTAIERESLVLDEDEWPGRDEGRRWQRDEDVLHIELRRWADVLLIAPLDANTLAKLANGLADNCLTCVWRAWEPGRPVVLAPAMNTLMWQHPATGRHLRQLAADMGSAPPAGRAAGRSARLDQRALPASADRGAGETGGWRAATWASGRWRRWRRSWRWFRCYSTSVPLDGLPFHQLMCICLATHLRRPSCRRSEHVRALALSSPHFRVVRRFHRRSFRQSRSRPV